jgi:hypothetical protein
MASFFGVSRKMARNHISSARVVRVKIAPAVGEVLWWQRLHCVGERVGRAAKPSISPNSGQTRLSGQRQAEPGVGELLLGTVFFEKHMKPLALLWTSDEVLGRVQAPSHGGYGATVPPHLAQGVSRLSLVDDRVTDCLHNRTPKSGLNRNHHLVMFPGYRRQCRMACQVIGLAQSRISH